MGNKWKGILASLGAALWIGAPGIAHASTCGDLNNSGGVTPVTSADLVILNQRVFSPPNPADCGGLGTVQCGDLNGSGGITVADLVVLSNAVAGNPVVFS